jgi:hypothetical protein
MRIRVQCAGVGGEGRCVRELVPPPSVAAAASAAAAPMRRFGFLVNGVVSVGDRSTKRSALPLAGMDKFGGFFES